MQGARRCNSRDIADNLAGGALCAIAPGLAGATIAALRPERVVNKHSLGGIGEDRNWQACAIVIP